MQKKIRVLQLGSPVGLYGAERWILALAKYLDKNIIHTWIAVIKDSPAVKAPLCSEADRLGIPSHIFEAFGKVNVSSVRLLKDFIVKSNIDLLHSHGYKTDIIGYFATRGTSCKIISTPHGWSKQIDLKLWCYEFIDRCIFPLLDAVAPLSEDLYRPLKRIPGLKKNSI